MTLDDIELLEVQIFSDFWATLHLLEATTAKRMKIDPQLSVTELFRTKSIFQRCID